MKYIQFLNDGADTMTSHTHLDGACGADFTLCGITLDGDPGTAGTYIEVEAKRLTCPDCVSIVRLCRNKAIVFS